jgi:hypothetical protein
MQYSVHSVETDKYAGNTTWAACPACQLWFPVSARMLEPAAPPACCPGCHREFSVKESRR